MPRGGQVKKATGPGPGPPSEDVDGSERGAERDVRRVDGALVHRLEREARREDVRLEHEREAGERRVPVADVGGEVRLNARAGRWQRRRGDRIRPRQSGHVSGYDVARVEDRRRTEHRSERVRPSLEPDGDVAADIRDVLAVPALA